MVGWDKGVDLKSYGCTNSASVDVTKLTEYIANNGVGLRFVHSHNCNTFHLCSLPCATLIV